MPEGQAQAQAKPRRKTQADRYREYREKGLCPICGQVPPRAPGTFYCAQCLADKAERNALLRRLNMCLDCQADVEPGERLCPECRQKTRDRQNRLRKARRESGKCRSCENPVVKGSTSCAKCRRSARRNRRENYYLLQMDGLCTACNGKRRALPGRTRCDLCLADANAKQAEREQRRKAAGTCIRCPRPPAPGKKSCAKCLRDARESHKRRYYERIENGICVMCAKAPPAPERTKCDACIARVKTYGKKGESRAEQS